MSRAAAIACLVWVWTGVAAEPIDQTATDARSAEGAFISWSEHVIDDPTRGVPDLSGSDGLAMADLDGDGYEDIVSVHESDTEYDGALVGHVRIAWGGADPNVWQLTTLASGAIAAAAEDVAIADANGDGWPDIVIAAELAHLAYFQNPGATRSRTEDWPSVIPAITQDRGSWIRVFFADLNGDERPEVIAANKGAQNPDPDAPERSSFSVFHLPDAPLNGDLWREQVLGKSRIPINAQPFDLDGDGDLDVIGGSRGEAVLFWFENEGGFRFRTHRLELPDRPTGTSPTGFHLAFADLNGDSRTDIATTAWPGYLLWLEAPAANGGAWQTRTIGDLLPDQLISVTFADIDGDGDPDAMTGSYSRGPRDRDGETITVADPLGRIAWFENPGPDAASAPWRRHDVSRRKRGMFDKWIARDADGDGDIDFFGTRGNSEPFDGVFWLEQHRTADTRPRFSPSRSDESQPMAIP